MQKGKQDEATAYRISPGLSLDGRTCPNLKPQEARGSSKAERTDGLQARGNGQRHQVVGRRLRCSHRNARRFAGRNACKRKPQEPYGPRTSNEVVWRTCFHETAPRRIAEPSPRTRLVNGSRWTVPVSRNSSQAKAETCLLTVCEQTQRVGRIDVACNSLQLAATFSSL